MILDFKGTEIAYTDEGKGTAVVLLHGFLENKSMWNEVIAAFKEKYRLIAIDLPGHGASGCLGYIHTMEMMAEAVEHVLNHLHIRKVVLVGHSMGGYVSLAYAENHPDKVKGLVLMNSTAKADSEEKKRNRDRAIEMVKKDHKSFVRMAVVNLFRPKNRKLFAEEIRKVKEEALATPLQGIIAALEGMKIRKDREVLLHFSPYKKMMIIGKKDPALNYETLIQSIEGTEVKKVEFPDGHMSHIENKVHFVENMDDFLKSV